MDYAYIMEMQRNGGAMANPYLPKCKKSKPAPMSERTMQILNAMRTGNYIPETGIRNERLADINRFPRNRQMRYFSGWAHDQWERVAVELKRGEYPLDERTIQTYKDDILNTLYDEFMSGVAFSYSDDWYQSFPDGGFFNPIRYESLYGDETGIAHRVEEYLECFESHPAVSMLLQSPKKLSSFDHAFVENGGCFTINFPTGSGVDRILADKIFEIETKISESIGEYDMTGAEQRVFVTRTHDYGDSTSTCAVLYYGFHPQSEYALIGAVKNAMTEAIPMGYWSDSRLSIDTKPHAVTHGEMEMARLNVPASPAAMEKYRERCRAARLDETLGLPSEAGLLFPEKDGSYFVP